MRSPEHENGQHEAIRPASADAVPPPLEVLPSGKSKALRWIESRLDPAIAGIPSFFSVPVYAWRAAPEAVLRRCREQFEAHTLLAIRSDARAEDGEQTHAGAFSSCLNVEMTRLSSTVNGVVAELRAPGDAVLIQAMAPSMRFTGVASTYRIDDGAPWYCIELNAGGEPCVTAGRASGRLYAFARSTPHCVTTSDRIPDAARAALKLLMHVESIVGGIPVEIEFALCAADEFALHPMLLQVRRFPHAEQRWNQPDDCAGNQPLLPRLVDLRRPDRHSGVHGGRTVYSLMADWNPAELLGSHPRPLALSIFKCLIADGNWWQARAQLGYRTPPMADVELLNVLAGRPFVDVRRSANSLLPASVDASTAQRLVEHWLDKLTTRPELQDKVEFAIYRTARDFKGAADVATEYAPILNARELQVWEDSLRSLTTAMMSQDFGPTTFIATDNDDFARATNCANGMARAFATIARVAFVAGAQLRSAVDRAALAPERMQSLLASSDIGDEMSALGPPSTSSSDQALRSGMFDIRQERWIPAPREFQQAGGNGGAAIFSLTASEARDIDALLREAGLPLTATQWLAFVQRSTGQRERAKRSLGHAIDRMFMLMLDKAASDGATAEELSWLTLAQWLEARTLDRPSRSRRWAAQIEVAQRVYLEQSRIITSPVLADDIDRHWADSLGILPNFIGREIADAPVQVIVDAALAVRAQLHGKIAVIAQADPGYDWLFDCGIAGLVTAWGGANSHMAIRCAETGTTAAIGCGEAVFSRIARSTRARIDPLEGSIWTR